MLFCPFFMAPILTRYISVLRPPNNPVECVALCLIYFTRMIQLPDLEPLRQYLTRLSPLEEQEWESLASLFSLKTFERKAIFQPAGKRCKLVGFIMEGCFRWVKNQHGQERTFDFATRHEFVTNYHSILTHTPSDVTIEAVETSAVACADASRFLSLFDSSFNLQKLGRHLAEQTVCYTMARLMAAYYETPQDRYNQLMASSPELFLRVPHHILANYLGMTKETLSRLRNTAR